MFYYYGAKNQLARYYREPKFNLIIEPFAGSAAYSMYHMQRNPEVRCLLIEKDERVYDLWRFLLACTEADIANYPTPEIGEVTSDFLIMTCAASNSISKCKSLKYTARLDKVFNIQKRRLLKLLDLRNRIEIFKGDYREADNQQATWFIDPPYQVVDSTHKGTVFSNGNGYAKGCNADSMDFAELARYSENREGQVIVCEKAGADWMEFEHLRVSKNSLNKRYTEVVWYNT